MRVGILGAGGIAAEHVATLRQLDDVELVAVCDLDRVRAERLAGGAPTPELLNSLGWARFKLGQADGAADVLRRSLALKADQPEIRRLLAQIQSAARAH